MELGPRRGLLVAGFPRGSGASAPWLLACFCGTEKNDAAVALEDGFEREVPHKTTRKVKKVIL